MVIIVAVTYGIERRGQQESSASCTVPLVKNASVSHVSHAFNSLLHLRIATHDVYSMIRGIGCSASCNAMYSIVVFVNTFCIEILPSRIFVQLR